MKNRRFLLNEEEGLEPIEIEPIIVEPEIETPIEEPQPEVVTTAYMDMLQEVLRKQWDVINACDGLVASLSTDENVPFNKEDVSAVLKKIVEDTTVTIGMATKAISTVDPKQDELMSDGVAKAEQAIEEQPKEEVIEVIPESKESDLVESKTLNEELAVDLSDLEYYDRYWAEEALYQLEYIMDNIEDYSDYEGWENLSDLPADVLKDICVDVADSVRNSDYLWEQINEIIMDRLNDSINEHIEEWQRRSVTEIGNENKEGEGE